MNRLWSGWCVVAATGLGSGTAGGQACDPGWTVGFPNAPGFDGAARAIEVFDDGSGPAVYVGGHFRTWGSANLNGVARWTGTEWAPVGGGMSPVSAYGGGVYWLGVLDDGSGPALYATGRFDTAGGVSARCVARWDGGDWEGLGAGLNDTVRMMAVFDDGAGPSIYAAGVFTSSGSTPVLGVARWEDPVWVPVGGGLGIGTAGAGSGYSLGVFDLGEGPRLCVGGKFSHAGGVPAGNIARWDGRQWAGIGSGVFGTDVLVMAMTMFDQGQGASLHIGGRFSLAPSSVQSARVARWTGSQWQQVGSDLSASSSDFVNSLGVLEGSLGPVLHAGGWFSGATWLEDVNYAARLIGGEWRTMGGGTSEVIRAMRVIPASGGDSIHAVGEFEYAGDTAANRVARWDGSAWHGYENHFGLDAPARCATVFDDGSGERVFVGGLFRAAGGRVVNKIAAWDGAAWHPVGGGITGGGPPIVLAMTPFDDGGGPRLYVGGSFGFAGGTACASIARWDGASWSALPGGGVDSTIRALLAGDRGGIPVLYAAGNFNQAGSAPAGSIASWDGASWTPVGTGLEPNAGYNISALAVFEHGGRADLYAGGHFPRIGGVPARGIARWDGSAWMSIGDLAIMPGDHDGRAYALTVWDDGTGPALYAAGRFTRAAGVPATNIARWNGREWSVPGWGLPGQPIVVTSGTSGGLTCLAAVGNGPARSLWVGGGFLALGPGGHVQGLTTWDGHRWSAPPTSLSFEGNPFSLTPLRGAGHTSVYVGGSFSSAGAVRSTNFAEWRACDCYPDCDADGVLTIADFACMQSKFVAGDPYADCGVDGRLTVADFGCFQSKFIAGCP